MTKSEIKKATSNELIMDLVHSYSRLCLNYNFERGTSQLEKHCADLEEEMIKRGMITESEANTLKA